MNKRNEIKKLAKSLLKESHKAAIAKIDKALDSGAVDISVWDKNHYPMLLPKAIATAILLSEADQYDAAGTSFEKEMKKDIKNIGLFL